MRAYVERWRTVLLWPYDVSTCGRIRSITRKVRTHHGGSRWIKGQIIKTRPGRGGYVQVVLHTRGRSSTFRVHNLVLEAFRGPRPVGQVARHLNGNPSDNRLENLKWGTYAENEADKKRHGRVGQGGAKLSITAVSEVRLRYAAGESSIQLAKEFGVSRFTTWAIGTGRLWKDV